MLLSHIIIYIISLSNTQIALSSATMSQTKPNILFILADDLGWGNVGFHNKDNDEIQTPYIDNLVANGLELYRHYVYSGCAPSRASLQSGRLPVHVTTNNGDGIDDPTHGIPLEMTTIASKLQSAGYDTHLVGKWDCGMATFAQLPTQKGYSSFYGYLSKSISYWKKKADNECNGSPFVDLWENNAPALDTMDKIDQDEYVEFDFAKKVKDLIKTYENNEDPFFIMYSMHLPHYPTAVPSEYLESFEDDENHCADNNDFIYPGFSDKNLFKCRSALQSQVKLMDTTIGGVVDTLKEVGLWDNTLIVFTSDNGGSLELSDTAGNNWPLRGGKGSVLEGGVRSTAFVSGGYLPSERSGDIEMGLMHLADWYATFCSLAGVESADTDATNHGLPDVDGVDMWPLISGQVEESPRSELAISHDAFVWNNYKLLVGSHKYAIWQESKWPNSRTDTQDVLEATTLSCKKEGCLFDVVNDPSEKNDLSKMDDYSHILAYMREKLSEVNENIWINREGGTYSCPDDAALDGMSCGCWMAYNNWNGFMGPYQDLTTDQLTFLERDYDKEIDSLTALHSEVEIGPNRTHKYDYIYYIVSIIGLALIIAMMQSINWMKISMNQRKGLRVSKNSVSYGTNL